jgi:hypothetical protein
MKKKIALLVVCLSAVFVLDGCSKNDQSGGQSGGKQQQGVPAEFASACQDKNEGDSCEMSMPARDGENKKISGKCQKASVGEQLSCMPEGGSGKPGDQKSAQPAQ